ncbi:MAG: acyltransferase [Acidobacteria bacterium]|nr:acyltransferase [Acidobacteriota bacterium]
MESFSSCTSLDSQQCSTSFSANRYYRPELDVVRFLAFFLVFLSHNLPRSPTPRLNDLLRGFAPIFFAGTNACIFGVSLFFTLSAFLICELLLREKSTIGTLSVKSFYIRRILRIWPLYYFALGLGVFFALSPLGSRSAIVGFGWYVIFMGAWHAAIHGWIDNPIFVLWTVSVEEQFYALVPWAIRFIGRRGLMALSIFILLVSNLRIYLLRAAGANGDRIWADSIAQFQCFAVGILLCLILRGRVPRIPGWLRSLLLLGSFGCWILAAYKPMHQDFGVASGSGYLPYVTGYLFASVGAVAILVAFLGINPRVIPGWAVSLGKISFGLYVFHAFARDFALALLELVTVPNYSRTILCACITFGLTVGVAKASYLYLERPFLWLKRRHALIESRPV